MVAAARAAFDRAEPRVIVGSSLGALVALSLAEILGPSSSHLVLVAPALAFRERWTEKLPEGEEFDLFHDLTSYRPHQRLVPYGRLELQLDGQRHILHGFVQTGVATEPTHIWIDSAGRPLLLTGGLLSMGLASIET